MFEVEQFTYLSPFRKKKYVINSGGLLTSVVIQILSGYTSPCPFEYSWGRTVLKTPTANAAPTASNAQ